jgi:hypothetical protein
MIRTQWTSCASYQLSPQAIAVGALMDGRWRTSPSIEGLQSEGVPIPGLAAKQQLHQALTFRSWREERKGRLTNKAGSTTAARASDKLSMRNGANSYAKNYPASLV